MPHKSKDYTWKTANFIFNRNSVIHTYWTHFLIHLRSTKLATNVYVATYVLTTSCKFKPRAQVHTRKHAQVKDTREDHSRVKDTREDHTR